VNDTGEDAPAISYIDGDWGQPCAILVTCPSSAIPLVCAQGFIKGCMKLLFIVDITKLRWRIERDYQELKQEVGLGHFEGRGWRHFHHHATMCIATYGFLVSERETIPPSGPRPARQFEELAVLAGYRPRGAATADRAPNSKFDRHHASTPDHRPRPAPVAMPVLSKSCQHVRSREICDTVKLMEGPCRFDVLHSATRD
jgi:hypothetical protein